MQATLVIQSLPLPVLQQIAEKAGLTTHSRNDRYGWNGSTVMLGDQPVGIITPKRAGHPITMTVHVDQVPLEVTAALATVILGIVAEQKGSEG